MTLSEIQSPANHADIRRLNSCICDHLRNQRESITIYLAAETLQTKQTLFTFRPQAFEGMHKTEIQSPADHADFRRLNSYICDHLQNLYEPSP